MFTQYQIYIAISEDGRQWEALKGGEPVLESDVGERECAIRFFCGLTTGRILELRARTQGQVGRQ